jgi:hypothetical protein
MQQVALVTAVVRLCLEPLTQPAARAAAAASSDKEQNHV